VEVPAGGSDGEDPLAAARRELAEETGLRAATWQQVGVLQALNGICRAPETVFLATGLAPVTDGAGPNSHPAHPAHTDGAHRAAEGISSVRRVPVPEVLEMVRRGEITDGETVAALLHALLFLGRVG
jgi:8-oxo-dGTP pyrophosphatase MutT (NUDIX family)